jgi:hypothetical protein
LAFCRFLGEKMACFWFSGVLSGLPGRAARLKISRGFKPAVLCAVFLRAWMLVVGPGLGLGLGAGGGALFFVWGWVGWSSGSGFLAGFWARFWRRFLARFRARLGGRFSGLDFGPVWAALWPETWSCLGFVFFKRGRVWARN